jgi:two-component system alkaline phosphatase synthesis response regulator PhoP
LLIYLVEDYNSIRELVAYTLHSAGFRAEGFEKPSAFWHACKTQLPDLVLLDLMLPEEDGISILKKLRNDPETRKMPIILLTAKSSEYDKVMGLENGADDYVAKPFSMMELLARVKALLRRVEKDEDTGLVVGNLSVNKTSHDVKVNGEDVTLTLKEFEL